MSNSDVILSQIRQRLEILYQMVDELEAGGGGGGGGTTNYNNLTNKPAIEGQQLVGNKTASDLGLATTSELNGKVDKVTGSSLMTTAQANKLEGIEAGAEVNVQADWNQANSSADDYIKNKPTLGAAAEKNVDTVPTDGSSNLITSGAVYDAVQGGGGGGTDLTPVNIGTRVATFPEEYRYLLQKRLPFKFTGSYPYGSSWIGSWSVVSEDSTNYYCASLSPSGGSNTQSFYFANFSVNKSTWAWSAIRPNNLSDILVSTNSNSHFYGNSNVKTISGNSNLDSQVYGRYYCTADNAATAINCPTTDAFQLLVYVAMSSGANEMIQQLTTIAAAPVVYRRVKTGGTWGSWYKFEGTIVS